MAAATPGGGDVVGGDGNLPGLGLDDHVCLAVYDSGSSSNHSSGASLEDEDVEEEAALSMEDTVKMAEIWVANPTSSHHWNCGPGGGLILNDDVWELRIHFDSQPNIDMKLCSSDVTFLNLYAVLQTQEEEDVDQSEDSDENSDEEQLHYEGDTAVEDLFEQEEEDVNVFARQEPPMQKHAKMRKKLEVRKGPTTRSRSSVLEEVIPDFIPSADEEDDWLLFEDEDDGHEPPSFVLPKGRNSRAKKRKPRILYNDKLEQPHQQLCLYMCFKDQHQFREALLSLHITHARYFRYHKNSDQRIIACFKQEHSQFCIVAAIIKGEKSFAIKKMRLEHTCPTNTEKSRISAKWFAKTYESLFRSDPTTSIHTLMDNCREKYGVDVGRHMAYRAKNHFVEVVLGEHNKHYPRLRDYAQTIMDTNPCSRVVVTTVTSKPTTNTPHPGPRFHAMFFCTNGTRRDF
ncbi:hypothetical protein D1007_06944 [Hordeum vulgare]|nr:hypothetical protein D1007_06944 [Hordeum vulgare]